MSYMNYIRYNYITSFTEDPNLGKSSQAPQFLLKVSALNLLYRIKNKIKTATDIQRNSQTLVNCEVMEKVAEAASHLPISPHLPSTNGSRDGQGGSHAQFVRGPPSAAVLPSRTTLAWPGSVTSVCVCVCVCVLVAQSCSTLRDPMSCSSPGSSAHGISQARTLEWAAISLSISQHGLSHVAVCQQLRANSE